MLNIIDDKLQELGITKNYKGYNQLKLTLMLALEDETRLLSVTKSIYEPLSEKHGYSYQTIERNIRTVVSKIYKENYSKLCETARYKLPKEPTASEFIAILVSDMQRSVV